MLNCLFNTVKLGHRKITLILNSDCWVKFYSAIALMVGCLPNYTYLVKCRHTLGLPQYFNFEV